MLRMRVQRAMQLHAAAQVGNPRGCVGRGRRTVGVRADKVQPYRRRRQAGSQGRPAKLPDLSHELFQWWTDMAVTLQARVSSEATWHQAELIIGDARRFIEECDREGVALPPAARRLPALSWTWIHRWRKEWGLTPPQTVNAKYNGSYEKVVKRLGWRGGAQSDWWSCTRSWLGLAG